MGVGGGWEAEGGLNHPLAVRKSRCVLSKAQKQPQCTCQDKTVIGNSLTPLVALLVRHPLAVRKSRCVLSKAQKQPQCTCQDKTVVGNSLTPLVALLVRPSGTIHPTVDRHEFTWSDK